MPDNSPSLNQPVISTDGGNDFIDINLLLSWGAAFRKVSKEETLFEEGERANFFYQVVTGKVKMVNYNEEGKQFIQGIFSNGESFGEPPLFDSFTYPSMAIVAEDGLIIKLQRESFIKMVRDEPGVMFKLLHLFACRLRRKAILLKEISSHPPEHRIKEFMQLCKEKSGILNGHSIKIEFTRQEIADITGLRVETVIRSIKEMEKKGIVHIDHGKVFY